MRMTFSMVGLFEVDDKSDISSRYLQLCIYIHLRHKKSLSEPDTNEPSVFLPWTAHLARVACYCGPFKETYSGRGRACGDECRRGRSASYNKLPIIKQNPSLLQACLRSSHSLILLSFAPTQLSNNSFIPIKLLFSLALLLSTPFPLLVSSAALPATSQTAPAISQSPGFQAGSGVVCLPNKGRWSVFPQPKKLRRRHARFSFQPGHRRVTRCRFP